MTKEQRDELREEERKLRDSLIDTFGEKSDVVKAFDEMSKAMSKEADKSIGLILGMTTIGTPSVFGAIEVPIRCCGKQWFLF